MSGSVATRHWLMKAEPETRIEKGKDVRFSVDDFERVQTTPWDGVRSHEAKKIMKERMKLQDRVLFYHVPGIAALAEVCKEGYPDQSAFDPEHPYYDSKSDATSPTWFLVDVKFVSRLAHFVPLKLLQHLATLTSPPRELRYLTSENLEAIKSMALLNRGRLSVQPVSPEAFEAVRTLGEQGGFDDFLKAKGKKVTKAAASEPDPGDKAKEGGTAPTGGSKFKGRRKQAPDEDSETPVNKKARAKK